MKNKQIIVLALICMLSIFLIVYTSIYVIKEIKNNSSKNAAEYEPIKTVDVETMADSERLEIINKYTLVNSDEFSINELYNILSSEELKKYPDMESFEKYINDYIIKNIELGRDYLNVEKKSQENKDKTIKTEYVISVYTSEEYIKLFDYENNINPQSKFNYYVLLIEDIDGYSLEIYS